MPPGASNTPRETLGGMPDPSTVEDARWARSIEEHRTAAARRVVDRPRLPPRLRALSLVAAVALVTLIAWVAVELARWRDPSRCEGVLTGERVELWSDGWGGGDWCVRVDEAGDQLGDARVGAGPPVRGYADVLGDNGLLLFGLAGSASVALFGIRRRLR